LGAQQRVPRPPSLRKIERALQFLPTVGAPAAQQQPPRRAVLGYTTYFPKDRAFTSSLSRERERRIAQGDQYKRYAV